MKPWDGIISEEDQKATYAAGFGRPSSIGKRPALLIIDVQYRTIGTSPKPILEAIKEFPTSCGDIGWNAMRNIALLLAEFRRNATLSDDTGRYSIYSLDPGTYQLRMELRGFQTAVRSGVLAVIAGTTMVNVRLDVGILGQEVTVVERESLTEPTRTDLSRVIGGNEIEALPNIGRNFVDFVKLSSSVSPGRENVGGGALKEPDTGTGSAAAPRLSFGGQTELNTMIQVDGADNIQTYTGLPRATPSQEAAREFRILNSTYLAEYGRSLGGFVNIVTKSGTNDFHGSAYYFGMNDRLNARSILNPPDASVLRQNQFGVTLGGPFQTNRTFFFGNYEGQRRAESNRFSKVVLDNLESLNAMRALFNLRPEVGNQLRTNDYDQFLVKVDRQLNEKHSVSLRYNLLDSETHNFLGGGGRASPASAPHGTTRFEIRRLLRTPYRSCRQRWSMRLDFSGRRGGLISRLS